MKIKTIFFAILLTARFAFAQAQSTNDIGTLSQWRGDCSEARFL